MEAGSIKVNVEVKNLEELKQLIEQAQKESAQLQRTIKQIKNIKLEVKTNKEPNN